MNTGFVLELAKITVLAPVVAGLIWFIVIQQRYLRDIETNRTKDMQNVIDRLLDLTDKWNHTLTSMAASAEAQKEAIQEIKHAVREFRRP